MEDLGKSLPAAEGIVEAEAGTQPKQTNEFCLNCGTKLVDLFCHHCGQKDIPRRRTMGELIENFIGSFYSFESKFFRTVRFILLKPGFLPLEYTSGKRESYYHPARAYVFISFVFFLLFFSLPDGDEENNQPISKANTEAFNKGMEQMRKGLYQAGLDSTVVDSIYQASVHDSTEVDLVYSLGSEKPTIKKKRNPNSINFSDIEYKTFEEYDSVQNTLAEEERDGWFTRMFSRRAIELKKRYKDDDAGKRFSEDFGAAFSSQFSTVLFYLLPVFALLFKLLYVRRDFYYSEHLVFAIFYYNFFYLAASVYLLVSFIPYIGNIINFFIGMWMVVYLPMAMKKMYNQSWRKTIFKFVLFSFTFMLCLGIGTGISAMIILFNL
jgi:ABC-type multidrug transport system fused ATPase/permease subunit